MDRGDKFPSGHDASIDNGPQQPQGHNYHRHDVQATNTPTTHQSLMAGVQSLITAQNQLSGASQMPRQQDLSGGLHTAFIYVPEESESEADDGSRASSDNEHADTDAANTDAANTDAPSTQALSRKNRSQKRPPRYPPELANELPEERAERMILKYIDDKEFSPRAEELTDCGHPYEDVFMWWFHRHLDRLRRKTENKKNIDLDEVEMVLEGLIEELGIKDYWTDMSVTYVPAVINYFADCVVPKCGFLVSQVESARRDPERWKRVGERRAEWAELADYDSKREVEMKWKAEKSQQAAAHWAKVESEIAKRKALKGSRK